ncbi:MAG: sarcosine oxidase subunit beta family protein [Gammaproteobacteria bacterium]|nr:sarcosine oxidase subunit beta family protein [Gammaproteobacteria bacterium]
MRSYSGFGIVRRALPGRSGWPRAWREAEPRSPYDVVIIGAGGHGLATAYYLAAKHGVRNVAVLERGWLGGGNTGRNTQVCRSNYFYPESAAFYEHSLRLYESLAGELNFNLMFSQRGNLELSHSLDELEMNRRWANAMTLNGVDSEILDRSAIRKAVPILELDGRFPVVGGFIQHRAGIARHDAVAWAFARASSRLGVDIVQQCEVVGFESTDSRIRAVRTSRGRIEADRFALCVAGHSSVLAASAGLRLPIDSIALQAMVSEPVKPVLHTVIGSLVVHCYVSQSDRGEIVIGGGADPFHSYAQRGMLPTSTENAAAVLELVPSFGRLSLMRQWAGVCDISPDSSPIVGATAIENLYLSTGWGTGGFKAIPAGGDTLAATVATGRSHPLLEPFSIDRFDSGRLIDEGAAAGVAH